MALVTRSFPGTYRDSVALMQLSSALAAMPDVEHAAVVMATPANLDLLFEAGLLAQPTLAQGQNRVRPCWPKARIRPYAATPGSGWSPWPSSASVAGPRAP